MFGLSKVYPYLEDQVIPDPKADLKNAIKIEDTKFGAEALYFYEDTTHYYVPYSSITSADSMVFKEHHSCCSGSTKMDVPKVHIQCSSKNIWLPYTSADASDKAQKIILKKLSH